MRQLQANSRSQPIPRVGNQNGHRRDIVQDDNVPRSGMQPIESGSSHRALSTSQNSSPPPNGRHLLAWPAKCPHRGTLHTVAYNQHEADQDKDGQQRTETFHLSDNSCDEYQNSHVSNDTELDTEPDTYENDIPDGATSVTRGQSRTREKQIYNRISTVPISTTSGSQEATLIRRTPAPRACIIRSSVYTAPTISLSGVSHYSSPLATPRTTTLVVRCSSPPGDQSTPRHEHIWPDTNSRRNTATSAEAAVVARAKGPFLLYTLFDEPLPGPVALMTEVHRVWLQALNHISDTGNIEASEESVKLVSRLN